MAGLVPISARPPLQFAPRRDHRAAGCTGGQGNSCGGGLRRGLAYFLRALAASRRRTRSSPIATAVRAAPRPPRGARGRPHVRLPPKRPPQTTRWVTRRSTPGAECRTASRRADSTSSTRAPRPSGARDGSSDSLRPAARTAVSDTFYPSGSARCAARPTPCRRSGHVRL